MKNSLLLSIFIVLSLGLSASTEAEISVNRIVERDLVPIDVKIKVTEEKGKSQTFSTHDEGKCYFDLTAGSYLLQIVSEHFPNYEVPLIIDNQNELSSFFFTILVTDLKDTHGKVLGMQVSSFHKKNGHQSKAYKYAKETEKMIELIELYQGEQTDLLVNSSFFYSTTPSKMRDLIGAGEYAMDHDEVSNVFYAYNGDYNFLNTKSEMSYTTVTKNSASIAESKNFIAPVKEKKPKISKPISASEINSKEEYYSVQLGVFKKRVQAKEGEFLIKNEEDLNVLCKGKFFTYKEAKSFKEELQNSGLDGVFVIGSKNGIKVSASKM